MKRSGAIWLVVGVIAVAAVLMYFVVLPQMKDGKTVEDIAKNTVEDVKQAVNDAGKQVEEVADGAEEAKATAFVKMARIGQDATKATDELQALLDKTTPTPEEITAAKAKLRARLLEASDFTLPADADSASVAALAKLTAEAKAAVAELDKLPADPAAAKKALADIRSKLFASLPEGAALAPFEDTQPVATKDGAATADAKKDEQKADGVTEAAKPADTAKADQPVDAAKAAVPAFDILRVEKDGSTVIAGRADPGAKVEIVDGDKVIASANADVAGDFAAVLDNPLTAGDHSIVLKATSKDGKSTTSEEVATVSVPKDASGELLAMVTKPGEASKIMTMPEVKDTEIASNKSVTPDASKETKTADGAATTQEAAKAETQDAAKADVTKTEEATKAADAAADTTAKVTVETPDLPASASDIASTPPAVSQDDAGGKTQEQQVAKVEQVTPDTSVATPADSVTQADQKQPVGAPEVMVSAVELEGDKIFIAGATRPGATVRLYADDQVVAEATADGDGRFVADGTIKLAVGNHTIRADVLSGDGSKVELRASVPFFRPEGDLAAVASNDAAKDKPAIEPLADGTFDKARNEAGKALGLLQGLYANNQMPSAEELAAARSSAEIALKSLAEVRVPADVDPALAAMATKASEEAGKALDRLKAVPADVAAFKSALGEVETIVGSAVKPATEVASANDAAKAAKEPAKQEPVAADQAKPADEAKPADTRTAASQTVDKTGDQLSSNDVQVTAKVDRLAQSTEATAKEQAKTETEVATEPADKPADAASATTTTETKTAADTGATTGDQTASQETASADQPKVIEQAPLKQSEGSVIIRRGDTLWQISRRVYGKGVRYTTIYVANKTQINDPDRIMPGQIFSMPGKWLDNAEELHKERLHHHKP
jgi:nucleoid-associated protein YgaU